MKGSDLQGRAVELTRAMHDALHQELEAVRAGAEIGDRGGRLLVALQYDRRGADADRPVLRRLLDWAIDGETSDEETSQEGYTEEMNLAAFLLTRFADSADLAQLLHAKMASFDAGSSIDREYLFASGIEPAASAIANLPEDVKGRAMEWMLEDGQPAFTESDISSWRDNKATYYPERWADEHLETLLERAMVWGERDWAIALVDCWQRESGGDRKLAATLAHYRSELHQYEAAIAARRSLLSRADLPPDERQRQCTKLVDDLLLADQGEVAALAFADAVAITCQVKQWERIGMGLALVTQGFAVASAMPVGEGGARLVQQCDDLARALSRTSLQLWEYAESAARHQGFQALATRYLEAAKAEQQRIGVR